MTVTCPWAERYDLANFLLGVPAGRPIADPADPDRLASGVAIRGLGYDPASRAFAAAEITVEFDRPRPTQDPAPPAAPSRRLPYRPSPDA